MEFHDAGGGGLSSNQSEDDGVDESNISVNNNNIPDGEPSYGKRGPKGKRKCCSRLTSQQSQILEGFFSVCAHPTETQRTELSAATGLSGDQVRFWFQNKRTHVKTLSEKEENYRLRMENDILIAENNKLKQMKATLFCPNCNGEPRQIMVFQEVERLRAQNEWMKREIARLESLLPTSSNRAPQLESSSENVFVLQYDAQKLAKIARSAVDEFVHLASSDGPMWLPVPGGSLETLNWMAYFQSYPGQGGTMELHPEATRANAVVMLQSKTIVEYLMDMESYASFFPGIVSGATTTKVYHWPSKDNMCYDGAMELVTVELVFPSPLVPARKCTFLRYCKNLKAGATAIVDISLEDSEGTLLECRKMASGVLIEPIRRSSCKVTVVEHVQVEYTNIHDLFKPCLSGLMFGARRLVMSMARQSARMRDLFHVTNSSNSVSTTGRKSIMKMADAMLANYASSIAGIPTEAWTVQCGEGTLEDVKITYKMDDNNIAIVCATASFLLPVPMKRAFDLLRNNLLRGKWDLLFNGGVLKEEVRVASGIGSEDSVTVLHVKDGEDSQETTMILQNCTYDASGSFLVYSSIDKQVMSMMMNPGDHQEICNNVRVFPTGFSFVPIADAAQPYSAIGETGVTAIGETGVTAMTAGFQIPMRLASETGLSPRSVSSAIRILQDQIASVKDILVNCPLPSTRGPGPSARK